MFDISKIQIQKQITTRLCIHLQYKGCVWYFKDTNSKANHNDTNNAYETGVGVFDISKIQIQKQITTGYRLDVASIWVCLIFQRYKFKSKSQLYALVLAEWCWCVWYFKDTNSKANHNSDVIIVPMLSGVFDISKIQIQKQITTPKRECSNATAVCLIFQRYKFKSKSQRSVFMIYIGFGVFDISKIQIQKQITTRKKQGDI